MAEAMMLACDGCGQLVESAHISRRLERLAWATRYRPIHVQALLLGGIAPRDDGEFLYDPKGEFRGEAGKMLRAVGIAAEGKPAETVLTEFQKLGFVLTHVLECPLADGVTKEQAQALLEKQLPATIARIRRSLKPKRVLLLSEELGPLAEKLQGADLGCPVLPAPGGTFLASENATEEELESSRVALGIVKAPVL